MAANKNVKHHIKMDLEEVDGGYRATLLMSGFEGKVAGKLWAKP